MIRSLKTSVLDGGSFARRAVARASLVLLLFGTGCSIANKTSRSSRDQSGPPVLLATDPAEYDARSSNGPSNSMAPKRIDAGANVAARPMSQTAPVTPVQQPPVQPLPERVLTPTPPPRAEAFTEEIDEGDMLQLGPREQAISILLAAGRSDWPQFRANALEALTTDVQLLRGEIVGGLLDVNRGVRFVALMTLYKAQLWGLAPLVEPLMDDPSDSVRAAAILVLHASGKSIDLTPLAEMASSGDPEVRANAYVVLGLLGNPSAVDLIRASLGESLGLVAQDRIRIVDLQAAAALVRLGDAKEIEPLRAALFAPVEQSELTALAIQALVELKDKGSTGMLVRLVEASGDQQRPPEIRLFAASAVARLGMQEPAPLLRLASEYLTFDDPLVRAQVAILLGDVSDATALTELSVMMRDPSPIVQLAAAGGVLKLLPPDRASLEAPAAQAP